MSQQNFDVVIVGAGIIGCSISFELSKKGYRTLNVDKLDTAGYGSTSNSCGVIRAHYSTEPGVRFAYEGFFYWLNWKEHIGVEDERGLAKYVNCGTVLLKTQGHDFNKVLTHYRNVGVKFEEWDNKQLVERLPILDTKSYWPPSRPEDEEFWSQPTGEIEGAIYTPESGYCTDPSLATHNAMRAAESRGGSFIFNQEVAEVRKSNGKVQGVALKNGDRIDAPVVVNCAGPHSFIINRLAGVEKTMNIKTMALRHEVHHVPAPQEFDFGKDGIHTSDGDNRVYLRPEVGNHILVGSEDPDCDKREWIEDPDHYNRNVTEAQWRAQVYRAARRIPALKIPNQPQGVVDLYDVSDDWIPIYDKSDLGGFYMAIGTSGNQFKTAPVVGYTMAHLIEKSENGQDHDKDPVTVQGMHTGLELPLVPFSRLREINRDSSFNVNG